MSAHSVEENCCRSIFMPCNDYIINQIIDRCIKFPPRRKWDLCSSGMLRSVQLFSGQPLDCFTLEDGTVRLSGNVGNVTTNLRCPKNKYLMSLIPFLPCCFLEETWSSLKTEDLWSLPDFIIRIWSSWVQQCHFWRQVKKWHQSYSNKTASGIRPKTAIDAFGQCGENYCPNIFVLPNNIRYSTIWEVRATDPFIHCGE